MKPLRPAPAARMPAAMAHMARMAGDRRGVAAVEFALVLGPFLLLLLSMLELGFILIADISLHHAAMIVARSYRDAETAPKTYAEARALACADMVAFLACDRRFTIDLRAVDQMPLRPPQRMTGLNRFTTGAGSDIVVVRISYDWQGLTPVNHLIDRGDPFAGRLIAASFARRHETEP